MNAGKARRLRVYLILVVVSAIAIFFSYFVSYRGFVSVPNNAFLLQNFDDLDKAKSWNDLKEEHTSLEPTQFLSSSISVERTKYDVMLYPKTVLMVKVKIETQSSVVSFPSIMVVVLDPNEKVRGKAFLVFSSEDASIEKPDEVEYQFYYDIGEYLQGQRLGVIVQLWGSTSYQSSLPNNWESDEIYGDVPRSGGGYKQLGYWRGEPFRTFPPFQEITSESLIFQPFTVTGILWVILSAVYWTKIRDNIADWLEARYPNYKSYFGYAMVLVAVIGFYLLVQYLTVA